MVHFVDRKRNIKSMSYMTKYIKPHIQEIIFYKSLGYYGFFLSLTHTMTFFFWHHNKFIYQYLTKNANTLCWPQMSFCEHLRVFSPLGVEILLSIYLFVSLITALFFLNKKMCVYAYWLFLALNIMKLYMFSMDYRLMGNYHYIPFLVSFAYLFIRRKLIFIPLLIVCFYFFAGLLKISNWDWLTGLAFTEDVRFFLFLNEDIKMILCLYVVCLEIVGSWYLILKNRWTIVFYIQFILFHIMSYFIVGYFYPIIMLLLLSLFALAFIFKEKQEINEIFVRKNKERKSFFMNIQNVFIKNRGGFLFIFLVIVGNLLSVFIPGNAGLTGEGRLYGLNMYDAHTNCNSQIFLKFENKTIQESFSGYKEYALRIRCDPYIDFNTVKKICAFYKQEPEFENLDWSFYSKLRSDSGYMRLVNEKKYL